MINNKSNVIDIDKYRNKESDYRPQKHETKEKTLEGSFYEELRKIKRKEKGLLWD